MVIIAFLHTKHTRIRADWKHTRAKQSRFIVGQENQHLSWVTVFDVIQQLMLLA